MLQSKLLFTVVGYEHSFWAPDRWKDFLLNPHTEKLPEDVNEIIEHVRRHAGGKFPDMHCSEYPKFVNTFEVLNHHDVDVIEVSYDEVDYNIDSTYEMWSLYLCGIRHEYLSREQLKSAYLDIEGLQYAVLISEGN